MPINRNAAVSYARKYWNRVADDGVFWKTNSSVSLRDKRGVMNAPTSEGWEAFFVSNGLGGEDAIFRRKVGGRTEDKPKPIARWDELDDCTHYVCRCLIKGGIALTETPRANELAEAMINSNMTKVLALKTTKDRGQQIVDSGIFKPGGLIAYYSKEKSRYTHTAMFVGKQTHRPNDPGGITCHTICRFQGLTEAWNGARDDAWFLHGGVSYTLIHFSEDDPEISVATQEWLPGWWKSGSEYYCVKENGYAVSTRSRPLQSTQEPPKSRSVGHYFEANGELVFIWRKRAGLVKVEYWTAPNDAKETSVKLNGIEMNIWRVG